MPLDFALSLIVYELLIFATCPHSFEAISALASSLRLKNIRVRSVWSNVRQPSLLPRTERSELMDCVATMGITRHCRVRAKAFSSPLGSSSPTLANA